MIQVKFSKRITHFLGRNGYGKCTGIELHKTSYNPEADGTKQGGTVWFTPYTSKGQPARCEFSVPIEDIPEIIKNLKFYVDNEEI